MKNDKEELLFQMAASAHTDDESDRIEAEISKFNQENTAPPSKQILSNALSALKAQQTAEEKAAWRRQMSRTTMKAAGFVLAIGITGTVLVTSVDALRVAVANFFIDKYDKYTSIQLLPENSEKAFVAIEISWDNAYVPTVLPEGYELETAKDLGRSMKRLIYSNGIPEQSISLDQLSPGVNATVNTEGVPTHSETINGNAGFWFIQQPHVMVVWHNTEYVFVLTLPETIENFIEIAESVEIVK